MRSLHLLRSLRDPSDRLLGALMLAPAAVLLGAIVVYPVARLVLTSLTDLDLSTGLPGRFVGLQNYALLWQDPSFRHSLFATLLITFVTVPGAMAAGLGMALLANLPFRRKWPVRLALLMPWAMPLAFIGLIFAWFFNGEYGVVNDVLRRLGLAQHIWFNSVSWSFFAICITVTWKASSFVALILLAGLQAIPAELYEAAAIDGAGRFRQFRAITLPLLRPAIAVALIFRTIAALQTFDIPFTMTKGGPGDATETLAMYVYRTTVDNLALGQGATLAVALAVLSLGMSVLYLRQIRAA